MPIKYNYEVSVSDNKAKLNKDIFLFRGNRNIHYYFSIKGARFTFSKENEDLLESSNAIYAAVTVVKPNGVEVANAIAPVEDGLIHLKVTEDLIDEEVEVGDFDLVFDLFDDSDGAVTIPKIKGQFHVQERPCTTSIGTLSGNVNVVNQAVVDLAIATQENEQLIVVDDDGKYVKTTWVKGDKISVERLNKIEEGIEKNSTQYKDIANELGRDSNSNPIDMGTTATTIRGAIKEIKDNSNGNLTDEQIETAITAYLGKYPITGGLTSSQLSALNNMFKVCAYTKQDISTEYATFKTAFGISSGDTPITKQYTITNNLSNCKNSNSNTSIKESTSYVATITPDNGYIINQITVMMDGKDITNTAVDGSTIHITSVTGNIIITVTTTGIEPQPSLLYNWDLTNSLTDTVSNKESRLVGTTSEGTISSDGLTLGVSNDVGIVIDCDIVGKKIEFDLGDCPSRNTTTRAFVFGGTNAETLSSGLLYRNGYWTPYNASGWGDATTYSDSQMFNNSTVTIEVDSNYNAVFKFNNEIITTVILNNSNIQTFGFGSKSQSWIGSIVKAVRVYQM